MAPPGTSRATRICSSSPRGPPGRLHHSACAAAWCWDAADLEGLQTQPYRNDHLAIIASPAHPIAAGKRCAFEETLDYDHLGLPASTAVHTMLARAAAIIGKPISYRAVVSTFDACLRCVRANLGIAVVPREVAEPVASTLGLKVLPLTDPWSRRSFAICFVDEARLSPAARALAAHLQSLAMARPDPGPTRGQAGADPCAPAPLRATRLTRPAARA